MPEPLPNDPQSAVARLAAEAQSHLIEIRRDLHQHPELSHQEHRTAEKVAGRLR